MNETAATRVVIEVVAGVVPGTPIPEYTKRWSLTDDAWNNPTDGVDGNEKLSELIDIAQTHAGILMMRPNQVNWVRTEWIWL